MTVAAGSHDIGPPTGSLTLYTGREGAAARIGHDLSLTFATWSGLVVVDGCGPDQVASVEATVALETLEILEATGGVLPLTGIDRRQIRSTALRLLDADRHPEASFASTSVAPDGAGGVLHGALTVRGRAVPVSFTVAATADGWRASGTIRQSSFGITPYRAFLGALRLADDVRIVVEARLPREVNRA
jgi:polyisoprenoid-binding protein YceI